MSRRYDKELAEVLAIVQRELPRVIDPVKKTNKEIKNAGNKSCNEKCHREAHDYARNKNEGQDAWDNARKNEKGQTHP